MNLLRGPLAFRQAADAPLSHRVARTLLQIAFFWGFFLFVVPSAIVWLEDQLGIVRWGDATSRTIGALVFVAASLLGLSSAWFMVRHGDGTPLPAACARKLVVVGPYRWVRNPMALGGIVQGIAVGTYLGSWITLIYSLCGAFAWHFLARPPEEAHLVEWFGQEFNDYRASVRCWLPRLKPYTPERYGQ